MVSNHLSNIVNSQGLFDTNALCQAAEYKWILAKLGQTYINTLRLMTARDTEC